MVAKSAFQGKFYYYENVNGKEKKVEKEFKDKKTYDAFMKKYPMPSFGSFFGPGTPTMAGKPVKKALSAKKACKSCGCGAKKVVKKKK